MAETSAQGLLSTPKVLLLKGMLSTLGGMFFKSNPSQRQHKVNTELGTGMGLVGGKTCFAWQLCPIVNQWPHAVTGFTFLWQRPQTAVNTDTGDPPLPRL